MLGRRIVVFPVKGSRNWCFAISGHSSSSSNSTAPSTSSTPSWSQLWSTIRSDAATGTNRAELLVDFLAQKMNGAWERLGAAPEGSLKQRVHSLGLRLLSTVHPSENLLKSIPKDLNKLEITFPKHLNPRLVRRRLRHIAIRGCAMHRKYLYVSLSALPLTTAFSVLPLPNVPFFWILFRTYSNWRALQGSERLMLLVSDSPSSWDAVTKSKGSNPQEESNQSQSKDPEAPWVLNPSEDLEKLLAKEDAEDGVSDDTISGICKTYDLDEKDVIKYRDVP